MRTSVAVALCLIGLALAAEDSTKRKSRQILHPIVPLHPELHSSGHDIFGYVHHPQIVPALPAPVPAVPYAHPPVVPNVVLPHPIGLPIQHSLSNPAFDLLRNLQSTRPQVFTDQPNTAGAPYYPQPSPYYTNGQVQNQQPARNQQNAQNAQFQQQSAQGNNANQQNQQDDSSNSPRVPFAQPYSADGPFQSLITPNQDSREETRFGNGSPLNQNLGQQGQSQQSFGQNDASESAAYRPSPRLYGPSRAFAQYPSEQSGFPGFPSARNGQNGQQQQQPSQQPQQLPQQPQQLPQQQQLQTVARYNGPYNPQASAGQQAQSGQDSQSNGPITPIVSQTGEINHDGSYSYGFQSANGIQSSERGAMGPNGPFRYVQGSYSYTAPDGTPISAEYYADHTGFHVRGDHIPRQPQPQPQAAQQLPQQPQQLPQQIQQQGYDQSQQNGNRQLASAGQYQQSSAQPINVESN